MSDNFLIWDLDGTMLNSLGMLEEGLAKVLPNYQLPIPSEEVLCANFHGSLEDSIANMLGHPPTQQLKRIISDFLTVQDDMCDIIGPHLFPDALRLAKRAAEGGYTQILVTNRAHERRLRASPRSIVANSDLRNYIDTIICGDESQHRKPKPEVLGEIADRLGEAKVSVVGDQFIDADFARNLGAQAIIVSRDGGEPFNMHSLGVDWPQFVTLVQTLDEVML